MKSDQKHNLIQQYGASSVIAALDSYVTPLRKERIETVLKGRLCSIELAIEAPSNINNALAAVRTSEALGISTVHIICPEGDAKYSRGITQGAIYWVNVIFYDNLLSFLQAMQQSKIKIIGGTVTATMALKDVSVKDRLCIFLGNEKRGLSQEAVNACDLEYKIPMFGMTESFNLSVSAAISLYDLTTRKRALLKCNSDLSQSMQLEVKANYYLNSVGARLALALLKVKPNPEYR